MLRLVLKGCESKMLGLEVARVRCWVWREVRTLRLVLKGCKGKMLGLEESKDVKAGSQGLRGQDTGFGGKKGC
uniref:Uncharacterized protein n=1 Tax=Timema monikensis TaxID=170555 RepID=A0A7R9E918_9NEOP|nr:unnamed protein product [Timema monikensis]